MKKTLNRFLVGLALVPSLGLIHSASGDDIRLGQPGYGGNGCPQGSASAILSPDRKSLSILFDEYFVEATRRKKLQRKSCNLAIPVHIPQGLSVSIIKADYRGFNELPYGARSRFKVESFFAGRRGPRYTKTWRGPISSDFKLTNTIARGSIVWSPCGRDVNLRVNTSLLVRTRRSDALSALDSADFSGKILYRLAWRHCR
jgi:hypothetical protein